jgi:hypothetical protein
VIGYVGFSQFRSARLRSSVHRCLSFKFFGVRGAPLQIAKIVAHVLRFEYGFAILPPVERILMRRKSPPSETD